jgi:hypothetical protein
MCRRNVLVPIGLLVVVFWYALPAAAQKGNIPDVKKLPQARLSGTVEQVTPQVVTVSPEGGKEPVYVGINQLGVTTRVTILGTAEPEFLSPGMYVQFTAAIDQQGTVQGKVAELLIYEPEETTGPILAAEGDPGQPKTNADGVPIYFVRGQVRSNRNGELMVATTGKSVKMPLAEVQKINVGLHNLALASAGDKVSIVGKEVDKTKVLGERVDVTLSKPLAKQGRGR